MTGPIRRIVLSWLCLAFAWLASSGPASAHDPGLSTATLQLKPDKLEAVLLFSPADAEQIITSDQKRAGLVAKDDLSAALAELRKQAAGALEVRFDGVTAKAAETRCEVDEIQNVGVYVNFPAKPVSRLDVRLKWLGVLPPGHRQFFTLKNAAGDVLAEQLLAANSDTVTVQLDGANNRPAPTSQKNSFGDFLLMGVKHIWTGYDHLLFLFGLLVVTRNFASSLKIITSFTIAHSITLAVATLNLVSIPSRIVEPLIAASIVYVGIENLVRGECSKGRWVLTFAFGLIHGFGFASVLRELGVGADGAGIAVPLVAFNLGVEAGQLVIAGLALPLIWKLRTHPGFVARGVPAGSVVVTLLGSYWLVERVWF
jgi:hydrogenase/urease accessory protein HupE